MAITYTENDVAVTLSPATSGTLTIASNDVITAMINGEDNVAIGTYAISNSGTALTWNTIAITNTAGHTKAAAWWAFGDANGNRTVSVSYATGAGKRSKLHCVVHTGAHATTPVPAGKVSSGVGGTDVSVSITPTDANGSALWMVAGDWAATNTFAAAANCTLVSTTHVAGFYTATIIRPTTQPRTDGSAFTIGETDTGGSIAYVAFEVVAAAGGAAGQPIGRRWGGVPGMGGGNSFGRSWFRGIGPLPLRPQRALLIPNRRLLRAA